jgi:protein tyrosine/serine phosphatase
MMVQVVPGRRHLEWDGCFNTRDLGGLPTIDGRLTRWGSLVRADNLDGLTLAGWTALWAYGIRTVIDLRNAAERVAAGDQRPPGLTTVHVPLEDPDDRAFWETYGHLDSTPLIFQHFMTHQPHRVVAILAAIAQAGPGGVVFHCVRGRDRTGLIAVLLLALAGVAPQAIVEDYSLSTERLRPLLVRLNRPWEEERIQAKLAQADTTASVALLALLESLPLAHSLRAAGLREAERDALRTRLIAVTGATE